MQNYAINNRLTPFISMQNLYNAAYREEDREMLPLLKHYGVGCIPWSPLARGFLARPLDQQKDTTRGGSDRMIGSFSTDADQAINKAIEKLAKEKGHSMAQLAMGYVLSKPGITVRARPGCPRRQRRQAPIIGSTKLESIQELANAIHIQLSPEEIKSIDDLYKPKPIFGHK
jgi:aryl-alcohol dehydrogenase-like predicted oxidoreductase